jgi:hypothetical protein
VSAMRPRRRLEYDDDTTRPIPIRVRQPWSPR